MTDRELLEQLARHRSEDAFNEILRRHIDLVHSAGLRQLRDADTARDITQKVFVLLAEQAGQLGADVILTGWLYRTTRNLCLEHIRNDKRRREREKAAVDQLMNAGADQWEHVAPELEPAMDELNDAERHAVLLRFFENKSLRDVGTELGIGEDAAQKRVSRALDRLRDIFCKRGVTLSATALATTLSGSAVQAAPAAILTTLSTAAVATTAAIVTQTTTSTMTTLLNLKTAAAVLAAVAVTGTSTYLVKEREVDQLRTEQSAMTADHAQLAADQQQSMATIQHRDDQIARLKTDVADVPRLRGEVDRLNRALAEADDLRVQVEKLRAQLSELNTDQSPEVSTDDPVFGKATFTSKHNVTLKKNEVLIAGGWETAPGRRTVFFVRPDVSSAAGSATPVTEAAFVEFSGLTLAKYGMDFLDSGGSEPGSLADATGVLSSESFDALLEEFADDPDVKIVSRPRATSVPGRKNVLSVSGPTQTTIVRVLPGLAEDGDDVTLDFEANFYPNPIGQ